MSDCEENFAGVFLGSCCSVREAKAKANLSFRVSKEFCGWVISYNCFYYNPRKCDCLHWEGVRRGEPPPPVIVIYILGCENKFMLHISTFSSSFFHLMEFDNKTSLESL